MLKHITIPAALTMTLTFCLCSGASAQSSSSIVALNPTPHPATCADFTAIGNGQWRTNSDILIGGQSGMSIAKGARILGNHIFNDFNLFQWLEERGCK
jgi:hypothetical protein